MWQYNYTDTLCHYGVPGMRWGHRKAYYNESKKAYRKAEREASRKSRSAFGAKRIMEAESAKDKAKNAYTDMVVERAKYKSSKSKNSERAEYKSYVNSMYKYGLPGSEADKKGYSKATYNRLVADKGKEYADKVLKGVTKKGVASIVTGTAIVVGMQVLPSLIERVASGGSSNKPLALPSRNGIKLDDITTFVQ